MKTLTLEARLKTENDQLKKENKKLKVLVLQLQSALKMRSRKIAATGGSLAFAEAENSRLALKIKQMS